MKKFLKQIGSGIPRRQALVLLAMTLLVAVGTGTWYVASIITIDQFGSRQVAEENPNRACTSRGTMFDVRGNSAMRTFENVRAAYHSRITMLVDDRMNRVGKEPPRCDAEQSDQFLDPGPIRSLAAELPGYEGPVTFASFAKVLSEFQRVYECRLAELSATAESTVYITGEDVSPPEPATVYERYGRVDSYRKRIEEEKNISRLALERTLLTIRSFELAAPITQELTCLQLESADMRNGLSLLSDAVSCMPRIWDSVTSLHEPSP